MVRRTWFLNLLASAMVVTTTYAQVPGSISIQGRLTDSLGNPLPAGDKDFLFRIYGAESGGSLLWPVGPGESQTVSTDANGVWSAVVGSVNPIQHTFLADSNRWLEIEVDGTTLPRIKLQSAPYAMRIGSVSGSLGGNIRTNVTIGSGVSATGANAFAAGNNCAADGAYSNVAGGNANSASSLYSSVGGGFVNVASGVGARVGGGAENVSQGSYSTVAGGTRNESTSENSSVLGGYQNTASGSGSAVAGGGHNTASGINSFVGGGGGLSIEPLAGNQAIGDYSTISGGRDNSASGFLSTVAGGLDNSAGGVLSAALGGQNNNAFGDSSTVAGGSNNQTGGDAAFVGGGIHNSASGHYATVPGGRDNTAAGNYSFATGRRAHAAHNGSFVWSDNNDVVFRSSGPNQFLVRAEGGVCLGDSVPLAMLHVTNNGPNNIALYLEGAARDIAWGSGQILQLGQWDGASFNERMRISSSGNVGINTTTTPNILTLPDIAGVNGRGLANDWSTYSSRRWKDSIVTIAEPLEKINRLRGVTYRHTSDGQREIGLIAEEVGEVIPEVVQYEANGVDALSVNYSRLVALLVEGIKMQQEEIQRLKMRLDQIAP